MYKQCASHLLPHWSQLVASPLTTANLITFVIELILFHVHVLVFIFYTFAFCHVVLNVSVFLNLKLFILKIKSSQDRDKLAALVTKKYHRQHSVKVALLKYLRDATRTLLYLIHANHLYRDLVGIYFLIHLPVNAILLMWGILGLYPTAGAAFSCYVVIGYEVLSNFFIHFVMANRPKDVHAPVKRFITLFVEMFKVMKNKNDDQLKLLLKVALHIEKMNCRPQSRYGFQYSKTSLITFSTFFKVSNGDSF